LRALLFPPYDRPKRDQRREDGEGTLKDGSNTTNRRSKLRRTSLGFSLVEMAIVMAIFLMVGGITFMLLRPAMQHAQVSAAYNTVLMTMRRAREAAVAERKTYLVSFLAPNTIQMQRIDAGAPGPVVATYSLPSDIQFLALAGIPNTNATTPDNFGTGANAIDFDINVGAGGGTQVYFRPDGGGYDLAGNVNNGIVYIARASDLFSSRAITLYGASGRIRGWRLDRNQSSGLTQWSQQ